MERFSLKKPKKVGAKNSIKLKSAMVLSFGKLGR
jgi:hypothetical protein